jgi:hypothetical protein
MVFNRENPLDCRPWMTPLRRIRAGQAPVDEGIRKPGFRDARLGLASMAMGRRFP